MFSFFNREKIRNTLFYTTDIHSHLLPGIDDGSKNEETSIYLINKMMEWGITRILTTPHVTKETFENTPEIISKAYLRLQKAMANNNQVIEIVHSAEYRIDEYFDLAIKENQLTLLPNNHILVENSYIQEPLSFDDVVFDLKLRGYTPILAHPERYQYLWHRKKRYKEIHDSATLFQVNLLSLIGYYGKGEKEMALWLLENNMVDLVGTDLHNQRQAECITKYLETREYRKLASKINVKNDLIF